MKYFLLKILKISRGRYLFLFFGYYKYLYIYKLDREIFYKNIIVIMDILSCKMKFFCFGIFIFLFIDMVRLFLESIKGYIYFFYMIR